MPSSMKTPKLSLNRWLGSDKPKMEDFNEDNRLIDQWAENMRREIDLSSAQLREEIEEAVRIAKENSGGDFENQINSLRSTLEASISQTAGDLSTHAASLASHLNSTDRGAWNSQRISIQTYVGNGEASRSVLVGFRPAGGFVFAVGEPIISMMWNQQQANIWGAFFGSNTTLDFGGGGVGINIHGIQVTNNLTAGIGGFAYKLNENGVRYAIICWRQVA